MFLCECVKASVEGVSVLCAHVSMWVLECISARESVWLCICVKETCVNVSVCMWASKSVLVCESVCVHGYKCELWMCVFECMGECLYLTVWVHECVYVFSVHKEVCGVCECKNVYVYECACQILYQRMCVHVWRQHVRHCVRACICVCVHVTACRKRCLKCKDYF